MGTQLQSVLLLTFFLLHLAMPLISPKLKVISNCTLVGHPYDITAVDI